MKSVSICPPMVNKSKNYTSMLKKYQGLLLINDRMKTFGMPSEEYELHIYMRNKDSSTMCHLQ